MVLILVGAWLAATPAHARKPDLAEVESRLAEDPAAVLDALPELLRRRDREAAGVLRALALARAARDEAWRSAHPGWLDGAVAALGRPRPDDPHLTALAEQARATLREVVWEAWPADGSAPPTRTAALEEAGAALGDPFLLAHAAGLHHLREDGAGAVRGYLAAVEAAGDRPADPDAARALEMAIGGVRVFGASLDGAAPDEVGSLVRRLHEVCPPSLGSAVHAAELTLDLDALGDEPVERARAWLDVHPDDIDVRLALAARHERAGALAAAEQGYLEAAERAPDRPLPHLALSALYVNRASAAREALGDASPTTAEDAAGRIREDLERALPHLERAHALAPDDVAALEGLVTVTGALGDADALARWTQRLEEVRR